jgi:hypothetical protein
MTDERYTQRLVGQARTDFAIIEDDLEAIYARLARMPTRAELVRAALGIIFGAAGLVIAWLELSGGTGREATRGFRGVSQSNTIRKTLHSRDCRSRLTFRYLSCPKVK